MFVVTEFAPVEAADDTQLDVVEVEAVVTEATQPLYVQDLSLGLNGAAAAVQASMDRRW